MLDLKIGTNLFVTSTNKKHIEKIVRETPTMWITEYDQTRIYKKDQSIVGLSTGNRWKKIEIATQAHYDFIEKVNIIDKMKKIDLTKLDLSDLRNIDKIITEKSDKK